MTGRPGQSDSSSSFGSNGGTSHFLRELAVVKQRLQSEATVAVGMLEGACTALFNLDIAMAQEVLQRDDSIDREEVAIEAMCFRLMALQQPVARDFRQLAFILKVNADLERVADHACSIAKMTKRLSEQPPFNWPTALTELGQRVPIACHKLLRALISEDPELAKVVVVEDKVLDRINRALFDETVQMMRQGINQEASGLHIHRVGRELERVGDLMTNVAEDIVYLVTGEIIRHDKKRVRDQLGYTGLDGV